VTAILDNRLDVTATAEVDQVGTVVAAAVVDTVAAAVADTEAVEVVVDIVAAAAVAVDTVVAVVMVEVEVEDASRAVTEEPPVEEDTAAEITLAIVAAETKVIEVGQIKKGEEAAPKEAAAAAIAVIVLLEKGLTVHLGNVLTVHPVGLRGTVAEHQVAGENA